MTRKIYVTLSGGIGNQLHTFAAAYYVAKLSHRQIVLLLPKIDESSRFRKNERDISAFDFRDFSNNSVVVISRNQTSIKEIRRIFIRLISRVSRRFLPHLHLAINAIGITELKADVIIQNPTFLEDHYENSSFPVMALELDFPRRLNLKKKSTDFLSLEEITNNPERKKIIGVHLRLGDFRTWNNASNLLPPTYYLETLRKIKKQMPDSQIWLFSDEPKSAAVQLNSEFDLVEISSEYELTNAEEMVLLSQTDAILASKSTFSWWACFWKKSQTDIWYPDPNLCLPGWNDSLKTSQ